MMRHITFTTWLAIAMLVAVVLLVTIIPWLPDYAPYTQDLASSLLPPFDRLDNGQLSIFGTDKLGRDILSRMALAGRVSLFIGLSAVAVSMVIGVILGLVAGYFRGWTETIIMGFADLQLSVPRVLLLIAVTAILGSTVFNLTILLGLTSWVAYGRVARALSLSLREREFVLSAITQGATPAWNIRKHLLPNVLPQMVIVGSFELGQIIVLEAALSYLGLGIQPPLPSWGLMISEGQSYLEINPWLTVIPGLALFMLVAGVQFLTRSLTTEGEEERDIAVRIV
ncbi:MAG: ABC transporter permease [Pseudolabrys sp.]|jgi:peptide/nickel transport system permease protein